VTKDLYQDGLFQPDEGEFTRLPQRVRTLWRIQTATSAVIYAAAAGVVLGLLMPRLFNWSWAWSLLALCFPLQTAWIWSRLKKRWEFTGYRLDQDEVHFRYGLMRRKLEGFPYGRIQLVEVSSGFWARRLGLAYVSISIGARARSGIGPVSAEEASRLRAELMELTRAKAVEL
jgi:membrane protein YdbS with pleckstrin-like domain